MSNFTPDSSGQSSASGSSSMHPEFRQNPFLSEADRKKWDLRKVVKNIELSNPLKPLRDILREVKQYLVEVEDRGSSLQAREAQEIITNWKDETRTLQLNRKGKLTQKREHGSASSVGVSIGHITGNVVIHNSAQLPANSGDDSSSISSVEEHHNKMCRVYLQGSYGAEEDMDEQKEPARKWLVQGEDMTAHLNRYRRKCVKMAQSKTHLSDRHVLALSFIYLISPIDHCATSTLHLCEQHAVFEELSQTLPRVSKDVWKICRKARHAATRNQSVEQFLRSEYSAGEECDEEMQQCVQILYNLVRILPAYDSHQVDSSVMAESLKAFVKSSLTIDSAKGEWLHHRIPYVDNSTGMSTSLKPDYVMYTEAGVTNFELLFIEIKNWPSKGIKEETDTIKLGKEMKLGIDKLVDEGVEDPMTVGMIVEGCHAKTYYMDLRFDGLYRMVEICQFDLPTNRGDELLLVPPVLERLKQMKVMTEQTIKNIHAAVDPARLKTPSEALGFLRLSCGTPTVTKK
ncbi:uncharacterized protein BYT42DRAFT_613006 [Radiomyces spectabilis]|uniref:uncharacterized protein n=1 Tax=Radiomyces spectabilis TaxID=64574 RepID=UPI00221F8AFB|nr:uncharacterized protein BYT42DRAFT_613006 [Radiomyces spectabilis]KAI8381205.1 hypothetical protein BYT42DRAFT_613006 [Radiomyces spectabilis]